MKNLIFIVILFVATLNGFQIIAQENLDKSTKSDPNVPIFEIKNDAGQTVFAVYPGGVKVFIDEKLKATGGGFTVGRLGTGKATGDDYFTVNPGDVKVILPSTTNKATGGGFTVGRLGTGKATGDINYFNVTPDSTRVYVSDKSKGGFAVGKLGAELGADKFLDLTPQNYFIGHHSGIRTTGIYNLFLGYESGFMNTTGYNNAFLGFKSGYSNTVGYNNVFMGNYSGYSNKNGFKNIFIGDSAGYSNTGPNAQVWEGNSNVFIGDNAGRFNTTGYYNVFLGTYSGYSNTIGSNNIFIGYGAGQDNVDGFRNVFVGKSSGMNNTSGDYNTFLGMLTGAFNTSGLNNVFIGDGSGFRNTQGNANVFIGNNSGGQNQTGTGNVFIGSNAGYNETTSNKLYIDNSNATLPLIYGDFDLNRLNLNGNIGINRVAYSNTSLGISPNGQSYGIWVDAGSTSYAAYFNGNVHIVGNVSATGTVTSSDIRYKLNIKTLITPLDRIKQLRGVSYDWNLEKFPNNGFEKGRQIGLIAQEVEKVFPELVREDENGYKAIAYDKLTSVLIEAVKEQQIQIESIKSDNDKLTLRVQELESKNKELTTEVSKISELKKELEELKSLVNDIKNNK